MMVNMNKATLMMPIFKLILFSLLLSNFSAFSQKTTVWIVGYAETDSTQNGRQQALSPEGLKRAKDLAKVLKHENIKAIYIDPQKAAELTINPLAQKDRILPRVYTDNIKTLVAKITKNFVGDNVLIVCPYNTIVPLVEAFGGTPPFDQLTKNDFDMLFSIKLGDETVDMLVNYYGKPHHSTVIPQTYFIDKYYPGFMPPVSNH